MSNEMYEEVPQETAGKSRSRFGAKVVAILMALTMMIACVVPTVAGPIGRNLTAAVVYPIHGSQHVVSVVEGARWARHTVEVLPIFPIAMIPGPIGAWVGMPETGWELAQLGKVLTLPAVIPVVHATIWNGIDLALLGTAAVATPAVLGVGALGAGALALGAPVALGAAALGTTAVVGTGLALGVGALGLAGLGAAGLGAAALGTTAVVGTGLALGAAALGAGALATTAVVGTTALVGTGIVVHHLLNNSDENSDEQNENTENSENGTSSEDGNAQNTESAETPALAAETAQA